MADLGRFFRLGCSCARLFLSLVGAVNFRCFRGCWCADRAAGGGHLFVLVGVGDAHDADGRLLFRRRWRWRWLWCDVSDGRGQGGSGLLFFMS